MVRQTPQGRGSGWGPAGVAAPRPDKPVPSRRPYMPRKILTLKQNPACTVTTDNPQEPVVAEGTAEVNACVKVKPARVFALEQENFTGSPTRWDF